ncbi:MAG: YdcF family protein [Puniceicoccales bacterium]|nr:YdcF family protein [Puniceicoccales bacterium]
MVLGGGVNYHKDRSALGRLSRPSLARLTEGMRISRVLPEAGLIVSGAGPEEGLSAAREQERTLVSLGMERGRILRFDTTRDTREEIRALKKLAGNAPVALVTSAFHMKRAVALCKEMGVRAVPCPCDYLVFPATQKTSDFFKWGFGALGSSAAWFHEWLGEIFA